MDAHVSRRRRALQIHLRTQIVDEENVVTAEFQQPADFCYQLFCDVEQVPSWLWVVGTAVVQEQDMCARPTKVHFMGSLERASVGYSLYYSYNDALREVRWHTKSDGGVRRLVGAARFTAFGERCMLRYTLSTELAGHLPPWGDEEYREHPAETVVVDFSVWTEQQWRKQHPDADQLPGAQTEQILREPWDQDTERLVVDEDAAPY